MRKKKKVLSSNGLVVPRAGMPAWYGLSVCVLAALCLLMSPFVLPVMGQESSQAKTAWMEYGEKYWPTKPVQGGVYRIAASKYVGLMNPNHWPVNSWIPINFIYDRLIWINGEYKPSTPFMAESWEYVDPVTIIMRLRKGVQFHDGSFFNAQGFKYQIDWIKNKKNGAWTRAWLKPIKKVEVVDEYTVKLHTKSPWAGAFGILNSVPGMVISAKALKGDVALGGAKKLAKKAKAAETKAVKAEAEAKKAVSKGGAEADKAKKKAEKARMTAMAARKKADDVAAKAKGAQNLDTHPVGSGPYMLDTAKPGNYLLLKRNPNWWFGKHVGRPDMPYFDGIKFPIIPDPSIQLANLKAGKVDEMDINKSQYETVKNDPRLTVHVNPVPHVNYLFFNHAKGVCQDIRVRKAISHAVDRKALIAGTQFGLARIASCLYPVDHWAHNPNLKPVAYDPELSKKLLAEAGYARGLKIKGNVPNNPESQSVGVAVKDMLARVGINWQLEALDTVAISDRLKNLEYNILFGTWPWVHDPDLAATGMYHTQGGFNYGRSANQKAIELIEAGREMVDPDQRQKNYFKLEKVLYDNYEDAWLWYSMEIRAWRKNVMGWNNKMYLKHREAFRWTHPLWFKDGHP